MDYFHANMGKKGITPEMVEEYDKESKGKDLPDKVANPKPRPVLPKKKSKESKFLKYVQSTSGSH